MGGVVLGQVKAQQRPEQRETKVGGEGNVLGKEAYIWREGGYWERFYHWQCK